MEVDGKAVELVWESRRLELENRTGPLIHTFCHVDAIYDSSRMRAWLLHLAEQTLGSCATVLHSPDAIAHFFPPMPMEEARGLLTGLVQAAFAPLPADYPDRNAAITAESPYQWTEVSPILAQHSMKANQKGKKK
jgi:hypothetical protein